MVDVKNRRCAYSNCRKRPTSGVGQRKTLQYRKGHAGASMVSVMSRRCAHGDCNKCPSFGVEGSEVAQYCKEHADTSMLNVGSRFCSHRDCTKCASLGVEGGYVTRYCKQHAEDGMTNVMSKRCGHHDYRKVDHLSNHQASTSTSSLCSGTGSDHRYDEVHAKGACKGRRSQTPPIQAGATVEEDGGGTVRIDVKIEAVTST